MATHRVLNSTRMFSCLSVSGAEDAWCFRYCRKRWTALLCSATGFFWEDFPSLTCWFFLVCVLFHHACSLSSSAQELWSLSPAACCIADMMSAQIWVYIQEKLKVCVCVCVYGEGGCLFSHVASSHSARVKLQNSAATISTFSPVGLLLPFTHQAQAPGILSCHFSSILRIQCVFCVDGCRDLKTRAAL